MFEYLAWITPAASVRPPRPATIELSGRNTCLAETEGQGRGREWSIERRRKGTAAMSLNGVAAIAGIGETPYSRDATESPLEFQLKASLLAIEDAGLQPSDIDGLIPIFGAPAEEYVHNLGLTDVHFSGLVLHGGASAVHAIQMAAAAVATGVATMVLVPTGRNISNFGKAGVRIHQMRQFHCVTDFELPIGGIAPAQLTHRWRGDTWSSTALPVASSARSRSPCAPTLSSMTTPRCVNPSPWKTTRTRG
jgi:hypothetical protein